MSHGVADEGGWWPDFDSNESALDTLSLAIEKAGYKNDKVLISLDIAASEFYRNGKYRLAKEQREFTTEEWVERVIQWTKQYPIVSVEDPVAEDDEKGMKAVTAAIGKHIQVIGDDFLVTNAKRVERAIANHSCNAVLLKVNQAGTITEMKQAFSSAQKAGWGTIVSARSGETEDTIITHLAVGWNTGQLKVGSMARSERIAKWNEALRIERGVGRHNKFAGFGALPVRPKF
jgi:enolase